MEFFNGTPRDDGKYLTYVKDMGSPGWLKPLILWRHHGRWNFPDTGNRYWDKVFLWIGPLPSGRLDDFTVTRMEYDL